MCLQCGGGDFTDLRVFHSEEEEERLDTIGTNYTPNELHSRRKKKTTTIASKQTNEKSRIHLKKRTDLLCNVLGRRRLQCMSNDAHEEENIVIIQSQEQIVESELFLFQQGMQMLHNGDTTVPLESGSKEIHSHTDIYRKKSLPPGLPSTTSSSPQRW